MPRARTLRSWLAPILCVSLSSAGLAAMAHWEGLPVAIEPLREEPEAVVGVQSAAPKRDRVPTTELQDEKHRLAAAEESSEDPPKLPRVPDFKGKRLSSARREAKALGIKLVARTEYGERVDPEYARYYRVRNQDVAQGTELSPGSTVEVRVREIGGFAMGY